MKKQTVYAKDKQVIEIKFKEGSVKFVMVSADERCCLLVDADEIGYDFNNRAAQKIIAKLEKE